MFSYHLFAKCAAMITILLAVGCQNTSELDNSKDKVEERRQQYIQQRQQEFDEG